MYVHPVIFDYKNMTHEPSTTDGEPTDRPNKRTNGLTDPNKDALMYKREQKWGFYKKKKTSKFPTVLITNSPSAVSSPIQTNSASIQQSL